MPILWVGGACQAPVGSDLLDGWPGEGISSQRSDLLWRILRSELILRPYLTKGSIPPVYMRMMHEAIQSIPVTMIGMSDVTAVVGLSMVGEVWMR